MYYYEILHDMDETRFRPAIEKGIYVERFAPPDIPLLAVVSERIWRDEDGLVMYWKHREAHPVVNMKEFSWIKLGARKLP